MTQKTSASKISKIAILLSVVATFAAGAGEPPPWSGAKPVEWRLVEPADALAAFDRIKSMRGTWKAFSTRGWAGNYEISVLARGSIVQFDSRFVDEPDEGMTTVFYMDNGRLALTHFCEAGNQPRLALTEIGEDGVSLHFEYVDGGNLPSRDIGHMDEAIYRMEGDVFRSRWTWYSKGVSTWMEDIEVRRVSTQ